MKELFELISIHPFVALFLASCGGWIISAIIDVIKTRMTIKAGREVAQKQIESYKNQDNEKTEE